MSKLKVGDRVAVYGFAGDHPKYPGEQLFLRGSRGLVTDSDDYSFFVELDKGNSFPAKHQVDVHPKQCRKLVKRKPRRIFIPNSQVIEVLAKPPRTGIDVFASSMRLVSQDVEFVEVRGNRK